MILIQQLATGQIEVKTKLPEVVVAQILSQLVATMIAKQCAQASMKQAPLVEPVNGSALRIVKDN